MKITVSQLRRIIREEVEKSMGKEPTLADLRREFEKGDIEGVPLEDLSASLGMDPQSFLDKFGNNIVLDGDYVVATDTPPGWVPPSHKR